MRFTWLNCPYPIKVWANGHGWANARPLRQSPLYSLFGLSGVTSEHVDGVPEHRRGVTVEDLGEIAWFAHRAPPGWRG